MTVGGCILVIAAIAFMNIAEVRQWLPVFLIAGGALAVFGVKRFRDA